MSPAKQALWDFYASKGWTAVVFSVADDHAAEVMLAFLQRVEEAG